MSIKARIREGIERAAGVRIFRDLPHGVDLIADLRRLLPNFYPAVVFDVGANIGQSTREYLRAFPRAHIYCFEPVSNAYTRLQSTFSSSGRVSCFNIALSSFKGHADIKVDDSCSVIVLPASSGSFERQDNERIEQVVVDTLDSFCLEKQIQRIGLLKVDTKGHDLEVLTGGESMLRRRQIDLVQVEAGANPRNSKFVLLEVFKKHFEARGYFLFGIYEQVHEHYINQVHLRRMNAVFIGEHMLSSL